MILPNLKIGGAEKISITVLNNLPNNLFKKYLIVFSKKGKNIKNLNKNINIIKNKIKLAGKFKICKRKNKINTVASDVKLPGIFEILPRPKNVIRYIFNLLIILNDRSYNLTSNCEFFSDYTKFFSSFTFNINSICIYFTNF